MQKEEKLQVLVSTMNRKNDKEIKKLLEKMHIITDYVIINQVENKKDIDIKNEKVIVREEKGLSLSRNLAIEKATADIILLADDDVIYTENYNEIIKQAYENNPDVDIICFWVKSRNKSRKVKRMLTSKIGYIKLMRICSFEISMRRERIANIKFDEKYGSGSKYNRGEENIFLCDCLRQGLKIKFVNKKIAEVEQKESSWYTGYTKEYFDTQGKIFKRMYPKLYKIMILQFAIRKYPKYKRKVGFIEALKRMYAI